MTGRTRTVFRLLAAVGAVAVLAVCVYLARPRTAQILVRPYVQPGDGVPAVESDTRILQWLTDQTPAEYVVEYAIAGGQPRSTSPERTAFDLRPPGGSAPETEKLRFFRYSARLDGLPLDADVSYRVRTEKQLVREGAFRSRASPPQSVKFVLVGDMANGQPAQNAVAWRIAQSQPDFVVALGDIVYSSGLVSEYLRHFWTTYNDVPQPGPQTGSPLMGSIPFYAVIGNHDATSLTQSSRDALGAYYFFRAPASGPGEGPWNSPVGTGPLAEMFRRNSAGGYPNLDAYSFDEGPAHFVVLNSNRPADNRNTALREWVARDLRESRARWKFVCYHAPAFHSSSQHANEQRMRRWHPLFEEHGVDATFAGHIHNYQRSRPLRFVPKESPSPVADAARDGKAPEARTAAGKAEPTPSMPGGGVEGDLTIDREFDGETRTVPNGIIHLVAGGGGAPLYGSPRPVIPSAATPSSGAPVASAEGTSGSAPPMLEFTARLFADRHSFAVIELTPDRLTLEAFDSNGERIDRAVVTKR